MDQLNATEAKREFGDLLIKAQSEPISIIKNGKPVAVMVSNKEFREFKTYKDQRQKTATSALVISNDFVKTKTPYYSDLFQWLKKEK